MPRVKKVAFRRRGLKRQRTMSNRPSNVVIPRAPKGFIINNDAVTSEKTLTYGYVTRAIIVDRSITLGNFVDEVTYGWSVSNLWINGISSTAYQGSTDISNMFDSYRIRRVVAIIVPGNNSSEMDNTDRLPTLYTATEKNVDTAPTLSTIVQKDSLFVESFTKTTVRTVSPRVNLTSSNPGLTQSVAADDGMWCRSNLNMQSLGMQIIVSLPAVLDTDYLYRIIFKVYFECKAAH